MANLFDKYGARTRETRQPDTQEGGGGSNLFDRYEGVPAQVTTPPAIEDDHSVGDSLERGLKSLGVLANLGGRQLARSSLPVLGAAEQAFGENNPLQPISDFVDRPLLAAVESYDATKQDPDIVAAGQAANRAWESGADDGLMGRVIDTGGAALDELDIGSAIKYMVEMSPGMVAGGGPGGIVSRTAVAPLARRAATEGGRRTTQKLATGAGVQGGTVAGSAGGPNLSEALEAEGGDLDEAIPRAMLKTGVEAGINAPFGAIAPFKVGGRQIINAPVQGTSQTVGGMSGAAGASASVGEDIQAGELALEGLFGAASVPVDVALATAVEAPGVTRRAAASMFGKDEADITADEEGAAAMEIQRRLEEAQSVSDSATLSGDHVADIIAEVTGTDRAPRRDATPEDVKRERRDLRRRQSEVGRLFEEGTDVLRRDDVDVDPDNQEVALREGAAPARNARGEQMSPDLYGAQGTIDQVMAENQLNLSDRAYQSAVRDVLSEPEADPVEIVRAYSQEAGRSASRITEARRARRDRDLRSDDDFTPQWRPQRDYRAGSPREEELTPRMRQELDEQASAPPEGVNTRQPGAPRSAVDRMTTNQPGGLMGDFIPGERAPESPGPQGGQPSGRRGAYRLLPDQGAETTADPTQQQQVGAEPAPTGAEPDVQADAPADTAPDTPADTAPDTPADTTPDTQAEAAQETGFQDSREFRDQEFERTAREMGLDETQIAQLRQYNAPDVDAVTGFGMAPDREPTLRRGQDYVRDTGEPATYMEMDLSNLGGLNDRFGHSGANVHFRAMADIVANKLRELAGDNVKLFRHGGDEMSAITAGFTPDQIDAAMAEASAEVDQYVQEQGLSDIPHTKAGGIPGSGIYYGVSGIDPDATPKEIFTGADTLVEDAKKARKRELGLPVEDDAGANTEENENVDRDQTETAGPGPAEPGTTGQEADAGEPEGASGEPAVRQEVPEQGRQQDTGQPVTDESGTGAADGEPDAEAQPPADDTPSSTGGAQFYSGVPLDKIAAALKRVLGGEAGIWKRQLDSNAEMMDALKDAGERRTSNTKWDQGVFRFYRWYMQDADDRLRGLDKRAGIPGLTRIADAFYQRSGEAAATGREPFHSRIHKKLNQATNRMESIRDKWTESNLRRDDETLARLRRLLENPNAARNGVLGEIANDIEAFFKDFLEYQRDGGLDIGEVVGYLPRVMDKNRIQTPKQAGAFKRAAAKAYRIDMPNLTAKEAQAMAEARWTREVFGDYAGHPGLVLHASKPGTADSAKARQISQKAMERSGLLDFLVGDPFTLMGQYAQGAVLRTELATTEVPLSDGSTQAIGPNWENWSTIMDDMIDESGTSVLEHTSEIDDLVASTSGVKARSFSGTNFARYMSMARTLTSIGLLDMATFTSLPEPLIAGLRAARGGTIGNAAKDIGTQLGTAARYGGDAARLILRLPKRERLEASYDLMRSLGEVAVNSHNAMSVDRYAGGEPSSALQSHILSSYFAGTRLEQFTNYTTVFAGENAMSFMRALAGDVAAGGKREANARFHLRDLNIPDAQMDNFLRFVESLGGDNPTVDQLETAGEMGGLYAGAMNKFINESRMLPTGATKPSWAAHPFGAAVHQLMSFPFSFTKHVLSRPVRTMRNSVEDIGKINAALAMVPFITGMTTVVGLQSLLGGLRDELGEALSGEERPEQSVGFDLERALSWAGIFGKADPIIQMVSGTRYRKSPAEMAMGPTVGRASSGLADFLQYFTNNSPETGSAEMSLYKTVLDLVVEPFFQSAMAFVPAGGMVGVANTAARVSAPRIARDRGANTFFPEAAASRKVDKRYGMVEEIMGMDEDDGGPRKPREPRQRREPRKPREPRQPAR